MLFWAGLPQLSSLNDIINGSENIASNDRLIYRVWNKETVALFEMGLLF